MTPIVLGFDTSGPWCGTAILQGPNCLAAQYENMQKGQAEALIPMIEKDLADASLDWSDLAGIGVGIGPGNFTGIRLSVSTARAMSLSLGIPAIGVSLLDALAYRTAPPVLACLDARRGQGYFQRFGYGDCPAPFVAELGVPTPHPGLKCIGNLGAEMAKRLGGEHAPSVFAPASAIARIATERLNAPNERPKPMYLREADATPPKDPPPAILP